jgi:hypothetical protein
MPHGSKAHVSNRLAQSGRQGGGGGGGGDGGDGGRGDRDDDFNKHNESGVSILGCDGKRYVVDEGTASYFYEIEALVEKDPEDPEAMEERQILAVSKGWHFLVFLSFWLV